MPARGDSEPLSRGNGNFSPYLKDNQHFFPLSMNLVYIYVDSFGLVWYSYTGESKKHRSLLCTKTYTDVHGVHFLQKRDMYEALHASADRVL